MVPAPFGFVLWFFRLRVRGRPTGRVPVPFFVSSYGGTRGGKVTTRRTAPKSDSTGSAVPSSKLTKDNGLNIADFAVGDMISHDQYGLGKVTDAQDKGRNSVITVGLLAPAGVKRLMLRVAPIERSCR